MFNALVVVWRESLEAMLVIGVLLSWIARQPDTEQATLRRGVWGGAGTGLALALALGYATYAIQSEFAGATLEKFQLAMVLVAAGVILQMVLWMHRHGRSMKHELEAQAEKNAGALGIGLITALAVAREGAETVVFLYGLGLEAEGVALTSMLLAACAGFGAALATAWLAARGARYLNYRTLFRISEILLLLIANALLANGIDRMIGMDWLPPLLDPAWDMSAILSDSQGVGRFLADFVGYRAQPAGMLLLASLAFWVYALWRMKPVAHEPPARA